MDDTERRRLILQESIDRSEKERLQAEVDRLSAAWAEMHKKFKEAEEEKHETSDTALRWMSLTIGWSNITHTINNTWRSTGAL